MAGIREIRSRIKSVESTGKITKSMKMVSASKLRKTQVSMNSFRKYYDEFDKVLGNILSSQPSFKNPFISSSKGKRPLYVLITGNRGLCGTYNSDLLHYFGKQIKDEERDYSVLLCGRWICEGYPENAVHVLERIPSIPDVPDYSFASSFSDKLKQLYSSGEYDEIVFVYQRYKSALSQVPCSKKVLPVSFDSEKTSELEFIFEPDKDALMNSLIDSYITNTVYSLLLELKSGEHVSRMSAMTAASDNTDELLSELNLKLNHARQAAITTEISEIVGGANSFKASG